MKTTYVAVLESKAPVALLTDSDGGSTDSANSQVHRDFTVFFHLEILCLTAH